MKRGRQPVILVSLLGIILAGCSSSGLRPQPGLNAALQRSADSRREPALGQRWLVSIASRNGRERIELVDLRTRQPVPLPGLNQAGSQPVSVSVSGNGERIAFVRTGMDAQSSCSTDEAAALQRVPIEPAGVPRQVSLDGEGRRLAVQVSREGRWDVDVIDSLDQRRNPAQCRKVS